MTPARGVTTIHVFASLVPLTMCLRKRNRFFPGKSRGSPLFFPGEPPFGLLSILFLPVSPPMLVLVGHCQAGVVGRGRRAAAKRGRLPDQE